MEKLLWLDLETTGLDEVGNDILEIGMVVTDQNLNTIDTFEQVIFQPQEKLDKMNEYVTNMHTKSGLVDKVKNSNLSLPSSDFSSAAWIKQHFPEGKAILHGNTIHFDRRFIRKQLPQIESLLNYRMVDISSFKECLEVYKPGNAYQKSFAHRSIDDLVESISEYKSYLKLLGLI